MKATKLPASQNTINKYLTCVRSNKVRSATSYGKVGILCDADH